MQSPPGTANNFTLLRLALATLVVFGHFKTLQGYGLVQPFSINSYADLAVDAFFVVSGFLIAGSYDKRPDLIDFYVKRFFRIYPLYAMVVIAQAAAMIALLGGPAGHLASLGRYLAANLLFANFLAYDVGHLFAHSFNPGINPSLWTLKIEVSFYALLPFLWMLTRRFGAVFLAVLYAGSTLFAALALAHHQPELAKQLPGQLRFFAVGIAFYRYGDRLRIGRMPAILLAVFLFALCAWCQMLPTVPMLILYPLTVGLFAFVFAMRVPVMPLKKDISFGVYLFHGPLIQLSLLLGLLRNDWVCLALIVATAYLLALAAERYVEVPGIAAGRRLLHLRPRREAGLPEPFALPPEGR